MEGEWVKLGLLEKLRAMVERVERGALEAIREMAESMEERNNLSEKLRRKEKMGSEEGGRNMVNHSTDGLFLCP